MIADNSKDTARFQLDRFLNSDNSHTYLLDPLDLVILHTIAYYMDVSKYSFLFKQATIAKRTRMNLQTVNHRIKKLRKFNLIQTKRKPRGMWITWGENLVICLIDTS